MLRLSALILACLLTACGKPAHEPIPAGATVLILGDSISYGTGANKGEDYPTLLAARTGWNIVNAGVPGDTSAGGLERLPDLLEEHAPKFVIVELGGNDFLQQQASSQVSTNPTNPVRTQVAPHSVRPDRRPRSARSHAVAPSDTSTHGRNDPGHEDVRHVLARTA